MLQQGIRPVSAELAAGFGPAGVRVGVWRGVSDNQMHVRRIVALQHRGSRDRTRARRKCATASSSKRQTDGDKWQSPTYVKGSSGSHGLASLQGWEVE